MSRSSSPEFSICAPHTEDMSLTFSLPKGIDDVSNLMSVQEPSWAALGFAADDSVMVEMVSGKKREPKLGVEKVKEGIVKGAVVRERGKVLRSKDGNKGKVEREVPHRTITLHSNAAKSLDLPRTYIPTSKSTFHQVPTTEIVHNSEEQAHLAFSLASAQIEADEAARQAVQATAARFIFQAPPPILEEVPLEESEESLPPPPILFNLRPTTLPVITTPPKLPAVSESWHRPLYDPEARISSNHSAAITVHATSDLPEATAKPSVHALDSVTKSSCPLTSKLFASIHPHTSSSNLTNMGSILDPAVLRPPPSRSVSVEREAFKGGDAGNVVGDCVGSSPSGLQMWQKEQQSAGSTPKGRTCLSASPPPTVTRHRVVVPNHNEGRVTAKDVIIQEDLLVMEAEKKRAKLREVMDELASARNVGSTTITTRSVSLVSTSVSKNAMTMREEQPTVSPPSKTLPVGLTSQITDGTTEPVGWACSNLTPAPATSRSSAPTTFPSNAEINLTATLTHDQDDMFSRRVSSGAFKPHQFLPPVVAPPPVPDHKRQDDMGVRALRDTDRRNLKGVIMEWDETMEVEQVWKRRRAFENLESECLQGLGKRSVDQVEVDRIASIRSESKGESSGAGEVIRETKRRKLNAVGGGRDRLRARMSSVLELGTGTRELMKKGLAHRVRREALEVLPPLTTLPLASTSASVNQPQSKNQSDPFREVQACLDVQKVREIQIEEEEVQVEVEEFQEHDFEPNLPPLPSLQNLPLLPSVPVLENTALPPPPIAPTASTSAPESSTNVNNGDDADFQTAETFEPSYRRDEASLVIGFGGGQRMRIHAAPKRDVHVHFSENVDNVEVIEEQRAADEDEPEVNMTPKSTMPSSTQAQVQEDGPAIMTISKANSKQRGQDQATTLNDKNQNRYHEGQEQGTSKASTKALTVPKAFEFGKSRPRIREQKKQEERSDGHGNMKNSSVVRKKIVAGGVEKEKEKEKERRVITVPKAFEFGKSRPRIRDQKIAVGEKQKKGEVKSKRKRVVSGADKDSAQTHEKATISQSRSDTHHKPNLPLSMSNIRADQEDDENNRGSDAIAPSATYAGRCGRGPSIVAVADMNTDAVTDFELIMQGSSDYGATREMSRTSRTPSTTTHNVQCTVGSDPCESDTMTIKFVAGTANTKAEDSGNDGGNERGNTVCPSGNVDCEELERNRGVVVEGREIVADNVDVEVGGPKERRKVSGSEIESDRIKSRSREKGNEVVAQVSKSSHVSQKRKVSEVKVKGKEKEREGKKRKAEGENVEPAKKKKRTEPKPFVFTSGKSVREKEKKVTIRLRESTS